MNGKRVLRATEIEVMLVVLGLAGLVLVAVSVAVWIVRWRHTPADLRGDWWPAFEAEFWAYARRKGAPPQPRRHGADSGSGGLG